MIPVPTVSIVTLLTDRREFIPLLKACVDLQDYDKSKIEWVIVDDSGIDSNLAKSDFEDCSIKPFYVSLSHKLSLGRKRNISCQLSSGEFIIFFDDDDIHYPNRISSNVYALTRRGNRNIAGASVQDLLDVSSNKIYRHGPYGPNHATAGTFFFRRELLKVTSFRDSDKAGEESFFLKKYTIPMHQLRPENATILLAHKNNTINKERFFKKEKFRCYLNDIKLPKKIISAIPNK